MAGGPGSLQLSRLKYGGARRQDLGRPCCRQNVLAGIPAPEFRHPGAAISSAMRDREPHVVLAARHDDIERAPHCGLRYASGVR